MSYWLWVDIRMGMGGWYGNNSQWSMHAFCTLYEPVDHIKIIKFSDSEFISFYISATEDCAPAGQLNRI